MLWSAFGGNFNFRWWSYILHLKLTINFFENAAMLLQRHLRFHVVIIIWSILFRCNSFKAPIFRGVSIFFFKYFCADFVG